MYKGRKQDCIFILTFISIKKLWKDIPATHEGYTRVRDSEGRLSTILLLYWIIWLYYQFRYLKNNINMPYFGNWKAITSVVKKACFEHWPYKIWLVLLQNCVGWEAYGFDQINLWMIFISLSSPIDSEKKSFDIIVYVWSNSILLTWFPFSESLKQFASMPEQDFSSEIKQKNY